jgi:hypothetical protein
MSDLKLKTAQASLLMQVVLGIVTASSLFFNIPVDTLYYIILLESIAQVVEFIYYAVVVFRLRKIYTWARYLDWYISTPVMLISTVAFFEYSKDTTFAITTLFQTPLIYLILVTNWIMLSFGYLVETARMPRALGLILGMLSFVVTFVLVGFVAIRETQGILNPILYGVISLVWGLYGIAASLPDVQKNVSYNFLDVISKNFYGIFLFAYTLQIS